MKSIVHILEIFDHFFGLIGSTWPPYEQAKNSFGKYFDFAETFDRKVRKSGVGISTTMRIPDFSIDFHMIKLFNIYIYKFIYMNFDINLYFHFYMNFYMISHLNLYMILNMNLN